MNIDRMITGDDQAIDRALDRIPSRNHTATAWHNVMPEREVEQLFARLDELCRHRPEVAGRVWQAVGRCLDERLI